MKILETHNPPGDFFAPGSVLSIGNFDGLHLGHQAIIARNVAQAKRFGLRSVVMTFEPHPAVFFNPDSRWQRLMTIREKVATLHALGPELLWIVHFDRQLANCRAEDFVRHWLLGRARLRRLVVGSHFALGKGREGTAERLVALGEALSFEVERCAGVSWRGEWISSTRIRCALERGEVEAAREMLGRPYALHGAIVSGRGRGRRWGVPTLNVENREQQWPADGVYVGRAVLAGGAFPAAINIGRRPTFGESQRLLEAHLLDYRGQEIGAGGTFLFYRRLRDELRYEDPQELYRQVERDLRETRDFFNKSTA